nr:PfkB family carbohydrate kinase [Arthrobacter sp. KBS0703]
MRSTIVAAAADELTIRDPIGAAPPGNGAAGPGCPGTGRTTGGRGRSVSGGPARDGWQELSEQRGLAAWLPRRLAAERPAITVVGDLMLDGWWRGSIDRMCREAPAPVVDIERRDFAPGGAANTAMNLAALGAEVRVAGIIGRDDAGGELKRKLLAAGIDAGPLCEHQDMVTTTKVRISSGGQVLLRFDDSAGDIPGDALAALAAAVPAAVERQAAVVICDYGTGVLAGPVRRRLIDCLARRGPETLVVVDAHDPDLGRSSCRTSRPPRAGGCRAAGPPAAGRARTCRRVSYTHLDVYKRQQLGRAPSS